MGRRKHEQDVFLPELQSCDLLTAPSESMADYYDRMEHDFDATKLTQRVYTKESESLQDWIKRLWYQYGFPYARPRTSSSVQLTIYLGTANSVGRTLSRR